MSNIVRQCQKSSSGYQNCHLQTIHRLSYFKKFKGENQNNISIFYLCHAVGCLKIAVALRSSLESICLTHEIS